MSSNTEAELFTKKEIKIFTRRYLYWITKKFKWLFIFTTGLIIANRLMGLAILYGIKLFIDAIVSTNENDAIYAIWFVFIAYCFKEVLRFTRTYSFGKYDASVQYATSEYVLSELIKKDASYYENKFSGIMSRTVTQLGREYIALRRDFAWSFLPFFAAIIPSFLLIYRSSSVIALTAILGTLCYSVILALLYRRFLAYSERVEDSDQKISGSIADLFTNIQTVTLFGKSKKEMGDYMMVAKELKRARIAESRVFSFTDFIGGAIYALLQGVLLYMYFSGWKTGILSVGDVVFIQSQIKDILIFGENFSYAMGQIGKTLTAIGMHLSLIHEKSVVYDAEHAAKLAVRQGQISLTNIAYSYKSGTNALKRLDTTFEAGKSYALVGHSGAGKSTVIKLLLRMYDPTKGEILIDGQNIKNVTLESLRSSIAYVPQDPALFHRSILDNIRYAKPKASRNEVIAAAKLAQCHEFVSKLKNGYDTVVGERGAKLSGGERQRVAIARAILKDAPILLLDEATSSLDSESEYLVQKALENLMKNRTSVVIAHRLSTIQRADKILVLEGGTIVDEGNHQELLNRKGVYKNLWERQSGARI